MKRFIAVFVALVMAFSFADAAMADNQYKDTLRIGLSYGPSASAWAGFMSDSDINVFDADYLSYITTIPGNTAFNVSALSGLVQSEYFAPVSVAVRLESSSTIYYNGKEYRGAFEVRNNGDLLRVINIVNTEDYLASVLGREMSASWPIEALKAQAVCARNYAMSGTGKHNSYGFDLCATVDCQVYGGVSSEAESTRRAVNETAGVTVTYNGRVVPLYYFSCDGGYTESSENVWVSAEGYLRGKQDIYENPEYATLYNWTKKMTKSEIEQILVAKGIYIGELCDVRIDEMSENHGVTKLTFVGTEGTKTVTKTQTRTTLSLNSQAYTIEKVSYEKGEETASDVVYALTAEGVVAVTRPTYYLTAEGLKEFIYEDESEEQVVYDEYIFTGHGWGHLVGMSQWGAYSMAKLGFTYKDILNYYFTDIIIAENNNVTENWVEEETFVVPEEAETEADEAVDAGEVVDEIIDEAETEAWHEYDEIQRNDTGI